VTNVARIVIRPPDGSEGHPMIDPTSGTTAPAATTPTTGRRHHRTRRLAAVAMVAAALALAACSSGGSSTPTTSMGGSSASSGSTQGGTTITISNFMFSPMALTVSPGATVTVVNKDSVAHTLTGKAGAFDTGDVQPGQSKTFTAPNKAGSYPYLCSIHQYMTGMLTVS
jgi:plastocyanin